MVTASTWRPRQPSSEGTNATDQTSTAPAARDMVRQPFLRVGGAPPAVASLLLLLLAGDVETNPDPCCYACGQNFRQSDTHQIAKLEPTNKPNAVVCPDLNRLYRGIAQPTVGPDHQLPFKRPTPATAVTTRSG